MKQPIENARQMASTLRREAEGLMSEVLRQRYLDRAERFEAYAAHLEETNAGEPAPTKDETP